MTEPIFHLAEPGDWARSTENYAPAGMERDGFIHCSRGDQLAAVARYHYRDHNSLILLTIDPGQLPEDVLAYEDLEDVGEEYPHIYSELPTNAVVATGPYLTHLEEGLWLDTRFDREWMDRMLHPDFAEVGRSGRTYDRQEAIESSPPKKSFDVMLPHLDYRLELIDEDVALVRYISRPVYDGKQRLDQRTSVWVNTNEGWRLRFHQGTPIPGP